MEGEVELMAIDGILLNQLNNEIKSLLPAKINKIQQISDTEILIHARSNQYGFKWMISAHSQYNRMNITKENYSAPDTSNNFIMVLRKYLDGGIIKSSEQVGLDRIVKVSIDARNDLGDAHSYFLYIELMGKYANVILVDENNRIIDAMKRIPPFEHIQRTIHPGAIFILPEAHDNKVNPFTTHVYEIDKPFTTQFHGFSPLLSSEVQARIHQGNKFEDIMKEIKESRSLFVSDKQFHCISLTHLNTKTVEYPLNEGIDHVFYHLEEHERITQQSGDLFKLVRKNLKKNQLKLPKLQQTLHEASHCEHYRIYGDLLYAYAYQYPNKMDSVELEDFETGKMIKIPLNIKLDIKNNAKKYYQKYHKAKTAQTIVLEQIELCEKEIEYFLLLEAQLELASLNDASEIRLELEKLGYLKTRTQKLRKKQSTIPHFMTFKFDDYTIYVGKNNIQNDYLTFHFGKKTDIWLHAKDFHGAHVLIQCDELSEPILRNAAMLAAYYSKGKQSSSVPVNYAELKNIKKVKAAAPGQVILTNYKTIYIDPEEDVIQGFIQNHLKK